MFVWTCVRGWVWGGEIHVLLAWTRMLYVLACWRAGVLCVLAFLLRAQAAVARTAVYGGFSGGRGDGSAGSMVGMLLRAVQVAVQR